MDTRDKRTSAIGSRRLPWFRRFTLPTADGAALSQADRQQLAFVYSGIEAGEAELTGTLVGRWSHVLTIQSPNRRIELQSPNERL